MVGPPACPNKLPLQRARPAQAGGHCEGHWRAWQRYGHHRSRLGEGEREQPGGSTDPAGGERLQPGCSARSWAAGTGVLEDGAGTHLGRGA